MSAFLRIVVGGGVASCAFFAVLASFMKSLRALFTHTDPAVVPGSDFWVTLVNLVPYYDSREPVGMESILAIAVFVVFVAAGVYAYTGVSELQEQQDSETRVRRALMDEKTRRRLESKSRRLSARPRGRAELHQIERFAIFYV